MRTTELLVITAVAILSLASICQAQDWVTYRTDNSNLEHNQVECVCGDSIGRVWVGLTYNGVQSFDGTTWQFFDEGNSGLAGNYMRKIVVDHEGIKWIASHRGLSRFDEAASNWTTYNATNSDILATNVSDIAIDHEGAIWLATSGGVSEFDGANFTNYTKDDTPLPTDGILAIAAAPNGDIWVGMGAEGAAVLRGGSWTVYSTANSQIAGDDIYDVMVDRNQKVWFACYDGKAVSAFDGTSWTTYNELNSGFAGRPERLAQHPNGSIWIATERSGLHMLQSEVWTVWDDPAEDGIGSGDVRDVGFDSHGDAWAATSNGLSYMEIPTSTDVQVSVYTNKSSYTSGESLEAYANVYNYGAGDAHGSFHISLQWPNGTSVYWWTGGTDPFPIPLPLSAGLVIEGYILHTTRLDTMFMQKGTYTWAISYIEGGTGAIMASDTASFNVQ